MPQADNYRYLIQQIALSKDFTRCTPQIWTFHGKILRKPMSEVGQVRSPDRMFLFGECRRLGRIQKLFLKSELNKNKEKIFIFWKCAAQKIEINEIKVCSFQFWLFNFLVWFLQVFHLLCTKTHVLIPAINFGGVEAKCNNVHGLCLSLGRLSNQILIGCYDNRMGIILKTLFSGVWPLPFSIGLLICIQLDLKANNIRPLIRAANSLVLAVLTMLASLAAMINEAMLFKMTGNDEKKI